MDTNSSMHESETQLSDNDGTFIHCMLLTQFSMTAIIYMLLRYVHDCTAVYCFVMQILTRLCSSQVLAAVHHNSLCLMKVPYR